MSTNHLPPEPPPSWTWKLPVEQHAGKFFPQQHLHRHRHQQRQGNDERELLFEKPLTPSDVGKLNRLVIPKQHAQRHFPFYGDCGDKGLLLSFEDESGRAWQFRYSYWTSSQSYVLTKGWSRFVKEKRLDAGDVVLFERRRGGDDRLCIGWKRRGDHAGVQDDGEPHAPNADTAQWNPVYYGAAAPSPPRHLPDPGADAYSYTAAAVAAARGVPPHDAGEQAVGEPVVRAARARAGAETSSRRLRLFGVNVDCGPEQEQPESRRPSSSNKGSSCMEGRSRDHRFPFVGGDDSGFPRW